MRKSLLSVATLCGSILAVMLAAAPASAQATRTWVSGVGDDANPCSRTAPCKTFAGAISKTAPAGEINVLDPGGFGAVTITKSITISSEGFEAGVLVSGTNGIVISAGPSDTVILKGLDIEGLGTGLDGVKVLSGAQVYVLSSRIHHFTGNAINMASSTSGARLIVKDSFIEQNGTGTTSGGILVAGTTNGANIIDTVVDNTTTFGVQVNTGNVVSLTRSFLSGTPSLSTNGGTSICFGPSNVLTGGASCTANTAFK